MGFSSISTKALTFAGHPPKSPEGLCFGKVNYFKLNIVGKAESLKLLCGRLFASSTVLPVAIASFIISYTLLYFRNWSVVFKL